VSRCSLTQLVKYQPKGFLCTLNIQRQLPEYTVAFVENLKEDEDSTGRLNLIVNFSSFTDRNKCTV
jgi:hypothetical protein